MLLGDVDSGTEGRCYLTLLLGFVSALDADEWSGACSCLFNCSICANYCWLTATRAFSGSSFLIACCNWKTLCWHNLLSCLRTAAFTFVRLSSEIVLFYNFDSFVKREPCLPISFLSSETESLAVPFVESIVSPSLAKSALRALTLAAVLSSIDLVFVPVISTFCWTIWVTVYTMSIM